VIVKEIERAGLPVVHICPVTPVALMVGSNRVVPGLGIVHPVGSPKSDAQAEKKLRRAIIEKALEALQTELAGQKVFITN